MPIIKSAIKANHQNIKRRRANIQIKKNLKQSLKNVLDNIKTGNLKDSVKDISLAYSNLDKAVKKNLISKNKAARNKHKLSLKLKNAGNTDQFVKLTKKKVTKVKKEEVKKTVEKVSKPAKKAKKA